MSKMFKNTQQVLSIVVAFAVIAVSMFTVVPGINLGANAATVTDTWDGTMATAFASGSGTEGDPYIIATAEQMAYLAKSEALDSTGKYYKVIDNAVFDMNGKKGITQTSDVATVKDADVNMAWADASVTDSLKFAGHFDGNGAIIYNLYTTGPYGGLFPVVKPAAGSSCTFKNITVAASYIGAYHYAGGIVGYGDAQGTGARLSFDSCRVENCYINDNGDTNPATYRTSALIVGNITHNGTTVSNCFAKDNVISASGIKGGFVGKSSIYAPNIVVKDSVLIGSLPYSTAGDKTPETQVTAASCYSDVYTDQSVAAAYTEVTTVADADSNMKGANAKINMPGLDWTVWIAFDGKFPDFRANHTLSTVSNGDAGHSTSCSDCGETLNETHNLVEDVPNLVNKCDCGYSTPLTSVKDTWDGTQATGFAAGTGTANDPYIIANAEQLAYVALSNSLDSKDKYFKVVDNAVFNLGGMTGITANSTADQVKAATVGRNWTGDGATFAGHFDGNGVVIYNMYSKGAYAGLFPVVKTDNSTLTATFANINVKASYIDGYHFSAGIVGNATSKTTKQFINVETCAVENCYIRSVDSNTDCNTTVALIAGSVGHNKATINNCLAKNNILEATNIVGGFVGNTSAYAADAVISNSVAIGSLPYSKQNDGSSKTLEDKSTKATCYSNVYTDQAVPESTFAYEQIKYLSKTDMSGAAGVDAMALDFADIWFANTATPEIKQFHDFAGNPDTTDPTLGHIAICADCGIVGLNLEVHNYVNGVCSVCSYACTHGTSGEKLAWKVTVAGDCLTADKGRMECPDCNYAGPEIDDPNFVKGHDLTKQSDGFDPDCANPGELPYWLCSKCNGVLLTDDAMSPDVKTLADTVIPATGLHVELKDSNDDLIYKMSDTHHATICGKCSGKVVETVHIGTWTQYGASGHTGKCDVCGYETVDGIVPHYFNGDTVCDHCGWVCVDHVAADGEVKIAGDCLTDRVTAQYCSICNTGLADKVETAKGHNFTKTGANASTCTAEGNVDYWTCSVCEKIYLENDKMAAFDKAVELSKTVVEKIPHAYTNVTGKGIPRYEYDAKGHWYDCSVCGKAEYAEHIMEVDNKSYDGKYSWCEDAEGYGCGYETFDYELTFEDVEVELKASTNAFTKDVIFDVFLLTSDDTKYADVAKNLNGANLENFEIYEVSPNEDIATGGTLTMTMQSPDTLGEKVDLYYVDMVSGKVERLNANVTVDEKLGDVTVVSTVGKVGMFAIAEIAIEDDTENPNDGNTTPPADNGDTDNTDTSDTSPDTGENTSATFVAIAMIFAVAIVVARKIKEA